MTSRRCSPAFGPYSSTKLGIDGGPRPQTYPRHAARTQAPRQARCRECHATWLAGATAVSHRVFINPQGEPARGRRRDRSAARTSAPAEHDPRPGGRSSASRSRRWASVNATARVRAPPQSSGPPAGGCPATLTRELVHRVIVGARVGVGPWPSAPRAQPPDFRAHLGLRSFRPRAGRRGRIFVGKDRPRRSTQELA